MFSAAAAADLVGKTAIVTITTTRDEEVIGYEQFRGRIVRLNTTDGTVLQLPSGEMRRLPADLRSLSVARAGQYQSRTGEIAIDPDLRCHWTYTLAPLR